MEDLSRTGGSGPVIVSRRQPWPEVNDLIAAEQPVGTELRWLERAAGAEEAREAIKDATVLMGAWVDGWPYRAVDLVAARSLRLVQLMSAGHDGIDLGELHAAGIAVANIGAANASTVAEHAMTLMLALLRQLPAQAQLVREGGWRPAPPSFEARGRTLGILGMGNIGWEFARRARAFDMEIVYHSRRQLPAEREAELGLAYVSFDKLLEDSDVLGLTVPLTPQTRGLIGAPEFARMKPSALVVNVSRGGILDEAALADVLRSGRLRGAGLDVLEQEPPAAGYALLQLPTVIVTPHQAGLSPDAWPRIVTESWANIVRAINGDEITQRLT